MVQTCGSAEGSSRAEALPGRKPGFVWRHSLLNVGLCPHLQVEAQFRVNILRDFIGMLPDVNEIYCGFDSGHWFCVHC
jgi:hypothetical protein